MSKRRRVREDAGAPTGEDARTPRGQDARAPGARDAAAPRSDGGGWSRILAQLALLTAVFAVTAGIAEIAGAANLGVSLGIGQIAFAIALVLLLSRG